MDTLNQRPNPPTRSNPLRPAYQPPPPIDPRHYTHAKPSPKVRRKRDYYGLFVKGVDLFFTVLAKILWSIVFGPFALVAFAFSALVWLFETVSKEDTPSDF